MKRPKKIAWGKLGRKLRGPFLTGVLVIVPIGVIIWVLVWFFQLIDNILQPLVKLVVGHEIIGVGFGIALVIIYFVGVAARNVGGRKLISWGEGLLGKIPIVRQVYGGLKQIVEGFSSSGATGFTEVVFVEFPRKGMRTIGFVTHESCDGSGEKLLNVFIPTAPNPTSGFLEIVKESEVIRTDIKIDDALKMVVSAGKVPVADIPGRLSAGGQLGQGAPGES